MNPVAPVSRMSRCPISVVMRTGSLAEPVLAEV